MTDVGAEVAFSFSFGLGAKVGIPNLAISLHTVQRFISKMSLHSVDYKIITSFDGFLILKMLYEVFHKELKILQSFFKHS